MDREKPGTTTSIDGQLTSHDLEEYENYKSTACNT